MGGNKEADELAHRGTAVMDLVGPEPTKGLRQSLVPISEPDHGEGRCVVSGVRPRARAIKELLTGHNAVIRHFML